MKACSRCGAEFPDSLRFCEECGAKLVAPAESETAQRMAALEQKFGELSSRGRGATPAVPVEVSAKLAVVGQQQAALSDVERKVEALQAQLANIGRAPALAAAGWEERLAKLEGRVRDAESAAEDVDELRRSVEELPSGAHIRHLDEVVSALQKATKGRLGTQDVVGALAELGEVGTRLRALEEKAERAAPDWRGMAESFEAKLRELDKWDSQLQLGLEQAATKADLNKIKAWIDQESAYLNKMKEEVRGLVAKEAERFIKREELARFREEVDAEVGAMKRSREQLPASVERVAEKALSEAEKRVERKAESLRKLVEETVSALEDDAKAGEGKREERAAALLQRLEAEVAGVGKRVSAEHQAWAQQVGREHAERLAAVEALAKELEAARRSEAAALRAEHGQRVAELERFKEKVAVAMALINEQRERVRSAEQTVAARERELKTLVESGLKGVRERLDAQESVLVEAKKEMRAVEERSAALAGLPEKVEERLAAAEERVARRAAAEAAKAESASQRLAEAERKWKMELSGFEERVKERVGRELGKDLERVRKTAEDAEAQVRRSKEFEAALRASVAEFEKKLHGELGRWRGEMKELGERIDSRVRYFEETRQEANEKLKLVRTLVERRERNVEEALRTLQEKVVRLERAMVTVELEKLSPRTG